jgi:hypothetical protein|tara:strand:+ start:162 stop:389 length:228 start_codon:yes stop_codon:yes gene_type:complete
MYFVVMATMLATTEPTFPVVVAGYPTMNQCRLELVNIAKVNRFELVVRPFVGYAIVKMGEKKSMMGFCIKDIRSI